MFAHFSLSGLRGRYEQLSVREQCLVALVIGAALYGLFDALCFASQTRRQQEIEADLKALQSESVVLAAQMSVTTLKPAQAMAQKEHEYRLLQQQVNQLEAVAGHVSSAPPKIGQLVDDVLAAALTTSVKTVGVRTVPVKPLSGAPRTGTEAPAQTVYKHGLELEVRGRYLDLLRYLAQLEKAHAPLFWSSATLSAGTFPDNTLRASVFLLSTQPKP